MLKTSFWLSAVLFVFFSFASVSAQKKDRVETFWRFAVENRTECRASESGSAVSFPKPIYPPEAKAGRIGGTVFIAVKIDEKGDVAETETISGPQFLQKAAASAARLAKFSPPVCDGAAIASKFFLTYHFVPFIAAKSYFAPFRVSVFTDLSKDSPFYAAVADLTENYRFAFSNNGRKFYPAAPLTRGDFAQTLRLTLDLLAERAKTAGRNPREINLYFPHNPQRITAAGSVKNLKSNQPFYDSFAALLTKYDIALTDEKNAFEGDFYLTNDEVIDWWTKIFGAEAIPVNFKKSGDYNPIISRGEFALFLQESLQVLTYKVLP